MGSGFWKYGSGLTQNGEKIICLRLSFDKSNIWFLFLKPLSGHTVVFLYKQGMSIFQHPQWLLEYGSSQKISELLRIYPQNLVPNSAWTLSWPKSIAKLSPSPSSMAMVWVADTKVATMLHPNTVKQAKVTNISTYYILQKVSSLQLTPSPNQNFWGQMVWNGFKTKGTFGWKKYI